MATTYTMTASGSLRDIGNAAIFGVATARTGGDIFNLNGQTLTIDQDTRYGLSGNNSSATAATTLGNITVSPTLGGTLNIDGRFVRLIPFNTGSGTITAGTLITLGTATAKVIGLYSTITTAPVLTGVATGFLKVTEWNGVDFPTTGTFTQAGYTFTITGASTVGFIEITGDEASTITANRLGTVNIRGEWFEVGTTTGLSTATYQLPTNGSIQYYPSVWVETAVGSNLYEAYPCAGSLTAASSTATDVRGKCCWISTAGVLRFGSDGTNTVGFVPVSGLRIRLPNILLQNCTAAARNVNALPNATLATRYDFTTTGGGVVNMDKVTCNWYISVAQAYSFSASYVGAATQVSLTEISQPMTINNLVIGQEAANTQNALILGLCYSGGTFTKCVFTRASLATAVFINRMTDCSGFVFSNCRTESRLVKANAGAGAWSLTRTTDCTWNNDIVVGAKNILTSCTRTNFYNTVYNDVITGITATTAAQNNSVWELATAPSYNCIFSGLSFRSITNTAPFTSLVNVIVSGCSGLDILNIGTYAAPLVMNTTATIFTGAVLGVIASGALNGLKMRRIYVSNTRLNGIYFGSATAPDNSSINWTIENVFTDYADNADLGVILNLKRKGIGGTPSLAASSSIYGTHFVDYFTSTTAGAIAILMNEPTSLTGNQAVLANGAAFTSAGGLYMPVVGQNATFETPEYVIGHTAFSATAGTMAGGTVGNYRFDYAIDKNDGTGWSVMTTTNFTAATLATALSGLTGIDALKGFKLRLKITTTTANTTSITSFSIPTTSTTVTQAYQYPLSTITLTLTGLQTGSDIFILQAGTTNIITSVDSNVGTTYNYVYESAQNVDIGIINPGYIPLYIRNYPLSSTNATLPIAQTFDRNYGA